MTGRAAGYCAGYPTPGFMNPGGGRGMGMAWGRGGGGGMGMAWRRGWGGAWRGGAPYAPSWGPPPAPYAPPAPVWGAPSPEDEVEMLRGQADWLKEQLDSVSKRLQELETGQEK